MQSYALSLDADQPANAKSDGTTDANTHDCANWNSNRNTYTSADDQNADDVANKEANDAKANSDADGYAHDTCADRHTHGDADHCSNSTSNRAAEGTYGLPAYWCGLLHSK